MEQDRDYYYWRAEHELIAAQRATEPAVVKAHYQLAGYYLDLVYGDPRNQDDLDQWEATRINSDRGGKLDELAAQLKSAGVIIFGPPVP